MLLATDPAIKVTAGDSFAPADDIPPVDNPTPAPTISIHAKRHVLLCKTLLEGVNPYGVAGERADELAGTMDAAAQRLSSAVDAVVTTWRASDAVKDVARQRGILTRAETELASAKAAVASAEEKYLTLARSGEDVFAGLVEARESVLDCERPGQHCRQLGYGVAGRPDDLGAYRQG